MLLELLLAAAQAPASLPSVPPALRPWTTARHYTPSSRVHLAIHDPAAGRHLTFSVYDYPRALGPRVVRSSSRYEDSVQLTLAQCPSLRANLETLARLPVPPLFLEGVSARRAFAEPNRLIYRIEGHARYPAGQGGRLVLEERRTDRARPGAIAAWSETLARDFEQCVQAVLSAEGAGR